MQCLTLTITLSEKKKKSDDSAGQERPKAKEARKERKVLEKKMALSRKRKLDSRLVRATASAEPKRLAPANCRGKYLFSALIVLILNL